ncbi:MAG TPA: PQQ-binding-like beta-propeller repeat protein [Bryobacteraceae bacterium]|jgi:outer membrane protein assembly factor BamB|nr:PQQ-binding-like beta-propeller repeat protein [Bryobacteraceae bacterium]
MKRTILLFSTALPVSLLILFASDPGAKDWPMWGGTPDRNMVSSMKGIPTTWDVASKKNVKWIGQLGSQSYGNPVVAGGRVYVGTNNELLRNPKEGGDRGVLMAFNEADGKFLWQHTNEKLPAGRANDWPYQGVCSSPMVEGDLVYYVSNRCEIVCLNAKGDGAGNAKVEWKFDMMEEVGSQPHNMANASPVSYGDLIYVSTANGQDESHVHVPSPRAPSIIAVSKKTHKLVWEDNSVGEKILHGQWASPTVAKIGDVVQVIHPQGDGWVRSYEALTGKKLWEFDTNPKDSVWPKTRNETIATPVVYENVVYMANGQDPEHGEGVGHLYAIDPTKRGDITKTGQIWHYDKIRRSVSTGAVYNGLVFYADFSGFLHCLDAKTGKPYWVHDMLAAIWGSPMVIDGKVYLGDEDGDVVVMEAAKEKKLIAEMNMGSSVYSTPVPANGTLFIVNRNQLFALANK